MNLSPKANFSETLLEAILASKEVTISESFNFEALHIMLNKSLAFQKECLFLIKPALAKCQITHSK